MSADNWMICPNCVKKDAKEAEAEKKELKKLYGKVSEQEYINASARVSYRSPIIAEHLREDFSIGMNGDGSFIVSYRGSCDVCGFNFEYNYSKRVIK